MTVYYLDASVALHALLGHSTSAQQWLDTMTRSADDTVISSRILRTEITRVFRREGLAVNERDALLDALSTVALTDGVLAAAEAIAPHVRTLDAIHLGSVVATGLDATVVTHDGAMARAATALGYSTFDPVADS